MTTSNHKSLTNQVIFDIFSFLFLLNIFVNKKSQTKHLTMKCLFWTSYWNCLICDFFIIQSNFPELYRIEKIFDWEKFVLSTKLLGAVMVMVSPNYSMEIAWIRFAVEKRKVFWRNFITVKVIQLHLPDSCHLWVVNLL